MKIGIIAYNAACNFGANLQLLSTVENVKKNGHDPYVINWIPITLESGYIRTIVPEQRAAHESFRNKYYNETNLCRTAEDVAREIENNNIDAIIIGSDAVAQHHPFFSRILFPSKRIISIRKPSEDQCFPNVFWGTFNDYLKIPRPIAILSASCQNSAYKQFSSKLKKEMYDRIKAFKFISVRDDWTQKMYKCISGGEIEPAVTPDPVFAFNYNVDFVPTKEEILKKFDLPEKYILFGLFNNHKISEKWTTDFKALAFKDNYACVLLSFPQGINLKHDFDRIINTPLDPMDWYALIKYSSGYIGHNMHPLVVAMHNSVPFYSLDNYGIAKMRLFVNEKSSKIYHILGLAGFLSYRHCDLNIFSKFPAPQKIYDKIMNFDTDKCKSFSVAYLEKYKDMMESIYVAINDNIKS
jgi:hypothetical protein